MIKMRDFSAKKMLKSQNAANLRDKDLIYVMEVTLKQSYHDITHLIQNFTYQTSAMDPKQQPKQKKLGQGKQATRKAGEICDEEADRMGFVFADVNRKTISTWVKKCQ